MPTTLSQVFRNLSRPSNPVSRHLPLINSLTSNSRILSTGQVNRKRGLMSWYKGIPELTALATKVAKDIVYRWRFEPINPSVSGRNKVMAANKFAQEIGLRKVLLAEIIDELVTGESFGWIGKLTDTQIKGKISELVDSRMFIETKTKDTLKHDLFREVKATDGFVDNGFIDEALLIPKKYRPVASSSMEIIYNEYDIEKYVQRVGLNETIFSPHEIIHYTQMDLDGKVNGFTPVESILTQLELLRQMWQNLLSMHKNGGAPDKLFVVENVQPNSPAYKRIEEQLGKYKLVENKHGNMLFTGKVNVQDLQQLDEMQFKDSGLYITGLMAMQWQIPRSSISYIVGGTNTSDDTGGNSEKGYWRNIEFAQMIKAETMNSQLWIPHFGVKIVFENTFVQQDVQMQTAKQLKLNNIQLMDQMARSKGKELKFNEYVKLTGTDIEDYEDYEMPEMVEDKSTLDKQLSQSEVNDSDDKKNVKAKKKTEQTNLSSRGMVNNTGTGKEMKVRDWDNKADMEYKGLIGSDDEVVNLDLFVTLYNQDKMYNSGMSPRLFMRQNDDYTSFKFKSSDFVYKVVLTNTDFEQNRVKISNLNGNIFRL